MWEWNDVDQGFWSLQGEYNQCRKSWDWEMIWRCTVPVTCSSHHLIPLSSSRTGPKLKSEDESYGDIQSISSCDLCIKLILAGWHG